MRVFLQQIFISYCNLIFIFYLFTSLFITSRNCLCNEKMSLFFNLTLLRGTDKNTT